MSKRQALRENQKAKKNFIQTKFNIMYNQTSDSHKHQGFGYKGRGCGSSFNRNQDGAFNGKAPWEKFFGSHKPNRKAANIQENDSAFIISLYAAGLVKSNFKIATTDDVLTISYNAQLSCETNEQQFVYREYEPASFERSFQLNGKVLTEGISAAYTDGVLVVTLPKNPEANKPAQEVNVL